MFIESPLDYEQGLAKSNIDVGLRRRSEFTGVINTASQFMNGNRQLVFQLDTAAQSIVDVKVRNGIEPLIRIAIADPSKIDLPMFIAGCFRIVRPKGRPSLAHRPSCDHQ
jgi:hypothetical protein